MRLKHIFYHKIRNRLFNDFPRISYSRSGEDLMIEEFFRNKLKGFYIDIGAYDPINYSNTYKFYLKGWRGINIDPCEEAISVFNIVRPRDINIGIAVGAQIGEADYYMFDGDSSMNTISIDFLNQNFNHTIKDVRKVITRPLTSILNEYLPPSTNINFMSVDVEGLDIEVLKSNDWSKYRPEILCIEVNSNIENIHFSDTARYMSDQGYEMKAYTYLNPSVGNLIFSDSANQY